MRAILALFLAELLKGGPVGTSRKGREGDGHALASVASVVVFREFLGNRFERGRSNWVEGEVAGLDASVVLGMDRGDRWAGFGVRAGAAIC